MQLNVLPKWEFLLFLTPSDFWIPKFSKISVKMWKIKIQKIIGNFFDKIRKLYLNGMLTQKFLAIFKRYMLNVLQTDILQKTVIGCPWTLSPGVAVVVRFDCNNKISNRTLTIIILIIIFQKIGSWRCRGSSHDTKMSRHIYNNNYKMRFTGRPTCKKVWL